MFIDPNFETLSGEFLVRDLQATAFAPRGKSATHLKALRRLWARARAALTGRPASPLTPGHSTIPPRLPNSRPRP
jgi:hypothetical protein